MKEHNIKVLSKEELENISYQTAYLLMNGWKRISLYSRKDDSQIRDVLYFQNKMDTNYIWVKFGCTRKAEAPDKYDWRHIKYIIVDWFDLDSAFELQEELDEMKF